MFPLRNAGTMSDAIALSSPNGRMSKRARKQAEDRLAIALFGSHSTREDFTGKTPQPTEAESLRRYAKTLRDLANRGMSTRKFLKEATKAEQQAELLEGEL